MNPPVTEDGDEPPPSGGGNSLDDLPEEESLDEMVDEEINLCDHAVDLIPEETDKYHFPGYFSLAEDSFTKDPFTEEEDYLAAAEPTDTPLEVAPEEAQNMQDAAYLQEWFRKIDLDKNPFKVVKEGMDRVTSHFLRRLRDYLPGGVLKKYFRVYQPG